MSDEIFMVPFRKLKDVHDEYDFGKFRTWSHLCMGDKSQLMIRRACELYNCDEISVISKEDFDWLINVCKKLYDDVESGKMVALTKEEYDEEFEDDDEE